MIAVKINPRYANYANTDYIALINALSALVLARTPALTPRARAGPGFPKISPGCLHPDNQTDLWCPGQNGYMCYKIPSLLRIPNTTELLAFIEVRGGSATAAQA